MNSAPIRVLVIDDSRSVRHMVSRALTAIEGVEVAGDAPDGVEGLEAIERLRPDIVTLDIEMPRLDGLEVVSRVRARGDDVPIIMLSGLTSRGAEATVEALSRGASDYVHKSTDIDSLSAALTRLKDTLAPKIRRLHRARVARNTRAPSRSPARATRRPASSPRPLPQRPQRPPRALLIGSSTGGPAALEVLLNGLPPDFPLPILVVQHMPEKFTSILARRLDEHSHFHITEARHGQQVHRGEVAIAPGGFHMRLARASTKALTVELTQTPPVNFTRPSVDELFQSAAPLLGGRAIVVVLTGMGSDGLEGARALHDTGATIFAQDEQSSVVWGMPGAIAGAGIAKRVLPVSRLPAAIIEALGDRPHGDAPLRPTHASLGGTR